MVDFICMGFLELRGTRRKLELQNEKFLPPVGFEPTTFRFEALHAIHCATQELMSYVQNRPLYFRPVYSSTCCQIRYMYDVEVLIVHCI